eukprot:TRINITY_DN15023_c0_g1_i2.p1 TRINITY_DN15023_c0_g1~~TRINITY_DN15023_c0_g1_i2.p1  ORF type:complete len:125 (+),score=28.84 TRINITY_DN15023_c0_g1_i2:44-418(+)
MSIYVAGGLFGGQVASQDATLAMHGSNFGAASAQLAMIDNMKAETAAADAALYGSYAGNTAQAVENARETHILAHANMTAATTLADQSNYRTLYSPSSACGPVGPLGATAPFVTPYVAGYLHQR